LFDYIIPFSIFYFKSYPKTGIISCQVAFYQGRYFSKDDLSELGGAILRISIGITAKLRRIVRFSQADDFFIFRILPWPGQEVNQKTKLALG